MQPGDLVREKYRIVRELGAGGHATVYLAKQDDIGREVAIKVLSASGERGHEVAVARFKREAKVIAQLESPHTVSLFDYGQTDEAGYFMVFELIKGEDLDIVLQRRGPLPEPVVVSIVKQLCHSLGEAHAAGVVHRDLKPSNIMVAPRPDAPWFIKLIDFGIARAEEGADNASLTKTGYVVGTPRFMAPEQMYGERASARTDLFALGLIIIELLGGFRSMDRQAVASGDLPIPPCSSTLRTVVEKLLEHDPNDRPESAAAVVEALNEVEELEATAPLQPAPRHTSMLKTEPLAPPESLPSPTRTASEKRLPILIFALVLLALAGVGLWLGAVPIRDAQPPTAQKRLNPGLLKTTPSAPSQDEHVASRSEETEAAVAPKCVNKPGTTDYVDEFGFSKVKWTLYVPPNTEGPRPLVIFFHGAGFLPRDYLRTGLAEFADRYGFVIAGPIGEATFAWPRDTSEISWVSEITARVSELACIDASNVFSLGDDTGGGPATTSACNPKLRAAATVGYLPHDLADPGCAPQDTPYIAVNPSGSKHIPINGKHECATGIPHVSLDTLTGAWRKRNHCSRETTTEQVGAAECTTWDCEADVRACVVPGGQQWPSMPERLFDIFGCDGGPYKVSPLELIGPFFASHLANEAETAP